MKVLFVNEVLGLTKLHYFLKSENSDKHNEYLLSLLKEDYLEDISDIFSSEKERDMVRDSFGFIEVNNKLYTMPFNWSDKSKKLRTEEKGINIIVNYNQYLVHPMKISFKEISESDLKK